MGMSEERIGVLRGLAESLTTYAQWLRAQDYKVTQEQYASHRHFLVAVDPLMRGLERLMREHGGNYSFPTSKFSREDMQTLSDALRILKLAEIPLALLSIQKEPSRLKLR